MIRIPAVMFEQSTITLYVGYMKASDLISVGIIESWDSAKGWDIETQGYQRASYEDHYKGIAAFLKDNPNAFLPTSVLLSARTSDQGVLNFDTSNESNSSNFGYLEVPDSRNLFIVDGQHRMLGLKYAIEKLGQSHFNDFLLPVVILGNADKIEELTQFHLINDRQKKIPTNLALALLGTVIENNPNVATMLAGRNKEWRIKATLIVVALNEDKDPHNIWANRVKLPNEPSSMYSAAQLASVVDSLKPFFSRRYPHKLENAALLKYLLTFWAAVEAIIPQAFSSPKTHVIQKTTGVYSINRVAAEIARQKPEMLTAPQKDIEPLLKTNKKHFDEKLWRVKGQLSKDYRGDSRFRDLADEILKEMGLKSSRPSKL